MPSVKGWKFGLRKHTLEIAEKLLGQQSVPLLPCPYCKPSASSRACKHARQMGMLSQSSQMKRE